MSRGVFAVVVAIVACAASVACARPDRLTVAEGVEAHVVEAMEGALRRLPAVVRDGIGQIRLERRADMGIPADMPLAQRMMGAGALAAFSNGTRTIEVFDAGAEGRPGWRYGDAAPGAVADFLADLADLLGVEAPAGADDPALCAAWGAFVLRVRAWDPGVGERPPVGDADTLDRFVREAVWRALGGEIPLEQVLFHELAHGLQLHVELAESLGRMRAWGTFSGWRDVRSGEPANGIAGGMFRVEDPLVLLRLLLAEDFGADRDGVLRVRGPAWYAPDAGARFVNAYGRFDLREDYAESVRLLVYDPGRLAREAPEKFLYVNAAGWNARGDVDEPGPLWIDAEAIRDAPWRKHLVEGAARLLTPREGSAPVDAFALAAVLRAHAGVFEAGELPRPHGRVEAPADLPPSVRRDLPVEEMTAWIGGVEFRLPAPVVEEAWAGALRGHRMSVEFDERIRVLLTDMDSVEDVVRAAEEASGVEDPDERLDRLWLVLRAGPRLLGAEAFGAIVEREAEFFEGALRPGVAARLRLERDTMEGVGRERAIGAVIGALEALEAGGVSYDGVEVARLAFERSQGLERRDLALRSIRAMRGGTWGAVRRVEALLEVHGLELHGLWEGGAAWGVDLLAEAEVAARGASIPRVRDRLVAEVLVASGGSIGDIDADPEGAPAGSGPR